MTNREPAHGYPIRDRSGVTVGWGWSDEAGHHSRDDRWEIESVHTGELGACTAKLACIARSATDDVRIAIHLHEILGLLTEGAMLAEEAEQLKARPVTRETVRRSAEMRERVEYLLRRKAEITKLCDQVPS